VDEFDDGTLQLAELERQRQAQIEAYTHLLSLFQI
jgi:hypothetical protein